MAVSSHTLSAGVHTFWLQARRLGVLKIYQRTLNPEIFLYPDIASRSSFNNFARPAGGNRTSDVPKPGII
ncbi:MAG: hypothetical protein OP8BY_0404 [Candidatus Saccharicenans subterraneus]|uniref:Uncharacterized protein n=1 Tax=Candidatus Saccharicenans subterraneus TaxID=2508984 RepID=A0A3E2BKM1_9BACT|nr:MAG: hypothetical protein OP8BY_0404 [Candidatus Saccharicenans subterraneum]